MTSFKFSEHYIQMSLFFPQGKNPTYYEIKFQHSFGNQKDVHDIKEVNEHLKKDEKLPTSWPHGH